MSWSVLPTLLQTVVTGEHGVCSSLHLSPSLKANYKPWTRELWSGRSQRRWCRLVCDLEMVEKTSKFNPSGQLVHSSEQKRDTISKQGSETRVHCNLRICLVYFVLFWCRSSCNFLSHSLFFSCILYNIYINIYILMQSMHENDRYLFRKMPYFFIYRDKIKMK